MADKFQSAQLLLQLYELRRERKMRKARNWFFCFCPESPEDVLDALRGGKSAYFRMVTSYWDMAAAFVNHGVIDETLFHETVREHALVFAKLQPILPGLREALEEPEYLGHLERLVLRLPDHEPRLERMRERARRMAEGGKG